MTDSMQIVQNKSAFAAMVNKFRAENPERQYLSNPTYEGSDIAFTSNNCFTANFVIPVVVHVVRYALDGNEGAGTNISDAQIANAIDKLNKAYRNDLGSPFPSVNTGIQFCLATRDQYNNSISGIYRYSSDALTGFRKTTDMAALIQLGQLPPDRYLNIYVVHDIRYPDGSLSNIQGTASSPGDPYQAVIVRYDWFGAYTSPSGVINAASLGLVLPHEIGHYLGLKHPFSDVCEGADDKTCKTEGDLCCDVPAVQGVQSSCSYPYNTCTDDYGGVDPLDQKENYMDYTVESCKTTFTPDQTSLMVAVLNGLRSSLASASNVNAARLTCCFLSPRFGGFNFGCKDKDTLKFEALKYTDTPTYKWTMYKRSGSNYTIYKTFTTTGSNLWKVFATDTGLYDVELTISKGTKQISLRQKLFASVVDCGPVLNDTRGNWYFGLYGGLNFRTNAVIRDPQPYFVKKADLSLNQIYSDNGTISQSNSHGQLLFYGGVDSIAVPTKKSNTKFRIYNKTYKEMSGSPILGDNRVSQPAIIIPFANDTNKYYVFSLLLPDALRTGIYPTLYYSIINMSLNSGLGDVQAKDSSVKDSTFSAPDATREFLTAIPRCDNRGYWVIFGGELYNGNTTRLLVYSADSSGVHFYGSRTLPSGIARDAAAKFSPLGNLLSIDRYLFLFDRSNASITLLNTDNSNKLKYSLGNSFSPDSKNLYRVEWYDSKVSGIPDKDYKFYLYQLNPFSSSSTLSKKFITEVPYHKQIQIGPDNKLYMSALFQNYVSSISNPNTVHTLSTPAGFNEVGVLLSQNGIGGTSELGLPNFVDAKPEVSISPSFNFSVQGCGNVKFIPDKCCAESYKWIFGDNDSSTVKFATHTYSDTGLFTVKLKTPGNTFTKTIHIGSGSIKARIIGDSTICDTVSLHEYTPIKYTDATYQWKQTGAKFFIDEGESATAKWNVNAQLKLIVTDGVSGCRDSVKINITRAAIPSNNTLPTVPLVNCDTTNFSSITGSTATVSGGGLFTYQWYYKSNVNNRWVSIPGATGKDYTPSNLHYSTQLVRSVNQGSCFSYSNSIQVYLLQKENTIKLLSNPCLAGQSFTVGGNNAGVAGGFAKTYSWQWSVNETSWTTYSGVTSKDLVNKSFSSDSIFVRRVVNFTGYCNTYSKPLLISPDIYITVQPKTAKVCAYGDDVAYFTVIVRNKTTGVLKYNLLVKEWNPATGIHSDWLLYEQEGNNLSVSRNVITIGDSVMYSILTPSCGYLKSNKVLFITDTTTTSITLNPRDTTVNEGDTVILHGNYAGSDPNVRLRWQINYESGGPYYTVGGLYPDSTFTKKDLVVRSTDYCADGLYRFVTMGACPRYSKTAQVTMIKKSDLWMRDSPKDTGLEANRSIDRSNVSNDIFFSPDLYNCVDDSLCPKHEGAEFKMNSPSFAHYTIRNKGTVASKPANLFLYWTLASTGEIWPTSWTTNLNNRFYNADSSKYFPTGGNINKKDPATNYYIGISIPAIAPKDSFKASYHWYPPNPAWYYKLNGTFKEYSKKINVCLLARIEYCPEYPHKMKFDELLNRAVDTNVINNNNIVTKNLWVYNTNPNNFISPSDRVWTMIEHPVRDSSNNPVQVPRPIKLAVDALYPTFFNYGMVIATFDDRLWDAWSHGGFLGTGFIPIGYHQVKIISANAVFDNLSMDSAIMGSLGLEFIKIDTLAEYTDLWHFSLSQYGHETGEYDGGTLFEVQFDQPDPLPKSSKEITKSEYLVYPNPANTQLFVRITSLPNATHKLLLTDLMGKILIKETYDFKQAGFYTKQLDISHLAAGTYFIRLSSNNKTEVRKITVLR